MSTTLPKAPPLTNADTGTVRQQAPRWRKMTWVLIVWCALILMWAIVGGVSSANTCSRHGGSLYLSAQATKNACDAGTGLGIAVILLIGFFGFVFFSLIWFMSRPRTA